MNQPVLSTQSLSIFYGDICAVQDCTVSFEKNKVTAIKWYKRAAEQGVAIAQFQLGAMYEKGQGVPQEFTRAYMWWTIAAEQGVEKARKKRDGIKSKMNSSQIKLAQTLALECMAKRFKGC